jgi:hypothetical protein
MSEHLCFPKLAKPLELFRLQRDSNFRGHPGRAVSMSINHHKLHFTYASLLGQTNTWLARPPMLPFQKAIAIPSCNNVSLTSGLESEHQTCRSSYGSRPASLYHAAHGMNLGQDQAINQWQDLDWHWRMAERYYLFPWL